MLLSTPTSTSQYIYTSGYPVGSLLRTSGLIDVLHAIHRRIHRYARVTTYSTMAHQSERLSWSVRSPCQREWYSLKTIEFRVINMLTKASDYCMSNENTASYNEEMAAQAGVSSRVATRSMTISQSCTVGTQQVESEFGA